MLRSLIARYRFPLLIGLGLRVVSSVWIGFVWMVLDPLLTLTPTVITETYNHLPVHQSLIGRMLLDVWLRWDAVHYMNIAWGGYGAAGIGDMNYWPLYPYLVQAVSFFTPGQTVLAGLLVSTVATILAMVLFWELVRSIFGDTRLANWTVVVWAIYPTSFFLVAPFTDSLLACLALGSLLAMQRKHWLAAGLLAAAAGLARTQGILLIVPLGISIALDRWKSSQPMPPASAFVSLALAPLGTGLFMVWRWQQGAPNIFSTFGAYSNAAFVDPVTGIFLAFKGLIGDPDLLQATELFSVLLFLGIHIWMLTRPEFRKGLSFILYGLLNILLNLTKHISMGASPLQSNNRYVLNALPAFVGFAGLLLAMRPQYRKLIVLTSFAAALVACALYAMWVFIG